MSVVDAAEDVRGRLREARLARAVHAAIDARFEDLNAWGFPVVSFRRQQLGSGERQDL